MGGASSLTLSSPSKLLARDHERIQAQLEELENAARAGVDSRTLCAIWRRVEHGILAHFETEETLLFPRFRSQHPGLVASLGFDHAQIRSLLAQVGLEVELHVVREHTVDALVSRIRRHAETEDQTLYRWAEELAEKPEGRDLVERLRARVHGGVES